MIFGALIAFLKGSEPPAEFGSNLNSNESEFINTTVPVGEEKSGFSYVSVRLFHTISKLSGGFVTLCKGVQSKEHLSFFV